jgi:hypothetical protein
MMLLFGNGITIKRKKKNKINSNTPHFVDLDAEVSSAHKRIGATNSWTPLRSGFVRIKLSKVHELPHSQ